MIVIYGYFERDNDKVFKFQMNNSYLFEVTAFIFSGFNI